MFSFVILLWHCQWCGASRRSHVQPHIKRMRFTRSDDRSDATTVSSARGTTIISYVVGKINEPFELVQILSRPKVADQVV